MQRVTMSPPWQIFYSKIKAMFGNDSEIHLFYDGDEQSIKFHVDNPKKAAALECILPESKEFGDVHINIAIIPSNMDQYNKIISKTFDQADWQIYEDAFKGNPAFSKVMYFETLYVTYVIFKKEVVQFYSDNMSDINGLTSTLYENIARDILKDTPGIFFCTTNQNMLWSGQIAFGA